MSTNSTSFNVNGLLVNQEKQGEGRVKYCEKEECNERRRNLAQLYVLLCEPTAA
jgi:hypothetical protein